jgi:hypothetical protein
MAIFNVAYNVRAREAGLLGRLGDAPDQLRLLARLPENKRSTLIPLAALTPDNLRATMQVTVLSIGQRRWKLGPALETPNSRALLELLKARFGYATDDYPHRDLLSDALASDGTLLPLIEVS